MLQNWNISILISSSIIMTSSLASAECLWSDREGLKSKFEKFVEAQAPKSCRWTAGSEKFGWQSAYVADGDEIRYDIIVIVNNKCFKAIENRLITLKKRNKLPQCGKYRARNVEFYPEETTMVFVFPSDESQRKELEAANLQSK